MKLDEVFDTFIPWHWQKTDKLWSADFEYKEQSFQVYIGKDSDMPGSWDIYFGAPSKLEQDQDALEPTLSKENMLKVYSTLVQIVTEFVNQNEDKVSRLMFAAHSPLTWDLYKRIARAVKLPSGWDMSIADENEAVFFYNHNHEYMKILAGAARDK